MAGEGGGYQRRRPETTALHQAVREGWPAVQGLVPKRLAEEVRRYLECGRLCYGFVHLECEECRAPTLVAFSCKSRGWCPSCTTRRALVTGAELEATLPLVAHRQWTVSLPRALRLVVVKRPALLKVVERALVRAVWRWQRAEAKRLGAVGRQVGGAVALTQWFGSALQLTPHLHVLVPEAVWDVTTGAVTALPPPSDEEVEKVVLRVVRQVRAAFTEAEGSEWPDDEEELPGLRALQAEAAQSRLQLQGDEAAPRTRRRRRVAMAGGFSLHADTAVHGLRSATTGRVSRGWGGTARAGRWQKRGSVASRRAGTGTRRGRARR